MADQDKRETAEVARLLERREFLRKCGKYAVVVPPAMSFLLSRGADAGAHNFASCANPNTGGNCPGPQQPSGPEQGFP